MNRIIEAGDTLSAAFKISLALGALYGAWRIFKFTKSIETKADSLKADIDSAKRTAVEFTTETINPASNENFINQGLGDPASKIGRGLFDLLH